MEALLANGSDSARLTGLRFHLAAPEGLSPGCQGYFSPAVALCACCAGYSSQSLPWIFGFRVVGIVKDRWQVVKCAFPTPSPRPPSHGEGGVLKEGVVRGHP